MQKTFYRMQKKEIKKIIRFRVSYDLKIHIGIHSIVFCTFLLIALYVNIYINGFGAFNLVPILKTFLAAFLTTIFVASLYMIGLFPQIFVSLSYFIFRVMDYVRIIDDDEFLFSYKMYKRKKEIFVRRDEVLQITFTNSTDPNSRFGRSGPTYRITRFMNYGRGTNFESIKMKLDLVKFRKPKRSGYVEEINEYIIPEFFEEQEELVEALHMLADNFEKRKYPEKNEQTPT